MKNNLILNLLIILGILLVPLNFSSASEFNPDFIISNTEMMDYTAMSLSTIQRFLDSKPGTLKDYKAIDKDDLEKKTSEIIYSVTQTYKINPKYILTLLQKEQSLIDDPNPSQKQYDWATGYAICDSCKMDDPTLQRFKGFAQQIHSAAAQMRYYLDHPNEFHYVVGQIYDIDGYTISPANTATASLYNYTPHYHGNLNFWTIWQKWFMTIYPDGSLLRADGEQGVWYIQHGLKRPISSWAALLSKFDPNKILTVTNEELEKYDIGLPIEFPEFSLLRSPKGTIFLYVDDQLRGISSMDVFKKIGFNLDEIVDLEWEEINKYPRGESITIDSIHPTGALLQNKITGGVYFVKNGIKKSIWSKEILKANFSSIPIIAVSPEELDEYELGKPVKFNDGELITSVDNNIVYVISDGKKWPIISGEVFEKIGYDWENIISTSQKVVDLHPDGGLIDIIN